MARKSIEESLLIGVLSPSQAARYLKTSHTTARALCNSGKIKSIKVGGKGTGETRINTIDLLEFIVNAEMPVHTDIIRSAAIFARENLQLYRYTELIKILTERIKLSAQKDQEAGESLSMMSKELLEFSDESINQLSLMEQYVQSAQQHREEERLSPKFKLKLNLQAKIPSMEGYEDSMSNEQ